VVNAWDGLNPPYRTIVADPPWAYDEGFVQGTSHGVGRLDVSLPYSSMSLEAIADLPVQDLADPSGAFLWLWTTNKYLPDAFDVIAAWGFRYRQCLVWHKGDAAPFVRAVAPNSGEFLLVARRGGVRRVGTTTSSIVHAVRGGHSAKPSCFLDLVEHVSPGPYVELFSRAPRLGWDSWGKGYEGAA
jgi:N6-adenosine-specific RNA methylase IME4